MNAIVNQNGAKFEMPLSLSCNNPKCVGEYELMREFPNDQELWVCPVCKDRWFVWVAQAKFTYASAKAANLAAAGEDCTNLFSSEAIAKNCDWCKDNFVTYDPEEELCVRCGITAKMDVKN